MAKDRVVFIPWRESQAGDFGNDTAYNNHPAIKGGTHHKRDWKTVYLDSRGTPLTDVGAGLRARIHVAGHGLIGDPCIYPPHGSHAKKVHYTELVEALIAQGLRKIYMGTLVCDVCFSALGDPPFARLVARELWSKGYKLCPVMGQKGSLQPGYVDGLGGKYRHRQVELTDGTTVKSSEAQQRFFGWM
jgi:hypothetical protein